MESASMNETSPPTSTNKIKYIKKSDGKILEETVDSLLNEQSVTDWYDYDPASKDKLNWQDPEFGKAIDRAAAKDYKQPSPLELKFEPEEVEATPLPTQAFGSVSGIKDTLKDLGKLEYASHGVDIVNRPKQEARKQSRQERRKQERVEKKKSKLTTPTK